MNDPHPRCPVSSIAEPATDAPLPPGPRGRKLYGLYQRYMNYPAYLRKLHDRYGDIVYFSTPLENYCVLFDGAQCVEVLERELDTGDTLFVQGLLSKFVPRVPTGGLPSRVGEEHRWRSVIMNPIFAADRMSDMAGIVVEKIVVARDSWRAGETIDVRPRMFDMMGGIMMDICFGPDLEADPRLAVDLRPALKWDLVFSNLPLSGLINRLPFTPAARNARIFAELDDLVDRAIARSRQPSHTGNDVVTQMVRAVGEGGRERPYSSAEIRDELYLLVLANMGAMANVLTWVVSFMARNPAACEKLAREADDVLGQAPIRASGYEELAYAQAAFREVLRLSQPGFVLDKYATRDFNLGGYRIPKGTTVQPCMGVVHRDANAFDEPDEFRPERWLEGRAKELPRTAYFPYGAGVRTCTGRELAQRIGAYFLAAMAQRWRFSPVSKRPPRAVFGAVGPYRVRDSVKVTLQERTAGRASESHRPS